MQKVADSISILEYLEKSAKHEVECLLNHDGSFAVKFTFVHYLRNSISYKFYTFGSLKLDTFLLNLIN